MVGVVGKRGAGLYMGMTLALPDAKGAGGEAGMEVFCVNILLSHAALTSTR